MSSESELERQLTILAHDPFDAEHKGSINIPIYPTSLFAFATHQQFDKAMQDLQHNHVYSRGNNPTVNELEMKLVQLEGGEVGKCFASGMAAISAAILSIVQAGDHIICVSQAYGPTREFIGTYLKRFMIESSFVDGRSLEEIQAAIQPNTKLLYLESPTSGLFQLQDLPACAKLAREAGIVTIVDSTWATPCYQQPLALGIDLVVHSITKYISGQSDSLGGVVIGSNELMSRIIKTEYMLFGGLMTPSTASQVMRGLRTLPLRLQRHEQSGLQVAAYLKEQPYVRVINHPGMIDHPQHELALRQMSGSSGLFSFESAESPETLKEWANRLKYFRIGVSWGGFESLITVGQAGPACGEGSRCLVRLHIGLESPELLIADMEQAWQSMQVFSKTQM